MSRYVIQLVVSVALGAVFTVVVAWLSAAWSTPRSIAPASLGAQTLGRPASRQDLSWVTDNGYPVPRSVSPSTELTACNSSGLGFDRYCIHAPSKLTGPGARIVCRILAGWPARCLSGSIWFNPRDARLIDGGFWGTVTGKGAAPDTRCYVDACPLPASFGWIALGPDRALPMCPLWSGLITNTLVWAAVLWVLTLGPFELRRAIRLGGGRCLSCGYALRGAYAAGCPECGWQRPSR